MNRLWRVLLWGLFLCYGLVMCEMLFGRPSMQGTDYWAQVWENLNLRPLHTVRMYLHLLQTNQPPGRVNAIMNLGGNVLLFTPIGLFFPVLFKKQRRSGYFFLTVVVMIVSVELIQLFALVGRFDVDDLLLNVLGAGVGYVMFRLWKWFMCRNTMGKVE